MSEEETYPVTDEELEDLESMLYLIRKVKDYPTDIDAWYKACERWKTNRHRRREFDKFVEYIRPRAESAKRRLS